MSELILHQFAASPFSEKIRRVLAFKGLAYKSVSVPVIMPKPDVVSLTGGYRRTPFLQIGADIYCDTALICKVLEAHQPSPSLYPLHNLGLIEAFAQWADSTLFWAAVTHNRGPHGAGGQFPVSMQSAAAAIFEDRKAMGFDVAWFQPGDATPAYKTYLARLSDMLKAQTFLFGEQACIADFCAYHPLWMLHVRSSDAANLLQHYPLVQAWVLRMKDLGHAHVESLESEQAIAVAAHSEPLPLGSGPLGNDAFVDEHGIALGSQVSITAESFGKEPTVGQLVAATDTHFTLSRTDARALCIHVHFPRIGYLLKHLEN
jgi:glutathione S-transferase